VGDKALPLDAKAVNDELAQAHLSVTYIDPQELPNGIVGAGVKITTGIEVPGSGVTNVSWTLGRAMAVIDSASAGDDVLSGLPAGDVAPEPPAAAVESPAPPPATAAAFDSAALPATAATPSRSTGSGSSTSAGYGSSASSTGASPATESPPAAPTESAAAPSPPVPFTPATQPASSKQVDSSAFFLLLVAGAAGVVVLSQVLSLLGVKVR
jgi:hypothetical protein